MLTLLVGVALGAGGMHLVHMGLNAAKAKVVAVEAAVAPPVPPVVK